MQILPTGEPSTWGTAEIKILITNVTNLALSVIGAIAIIYLIIGAYGYFTAFGNEEKANKAKTTITWAVVGIIIIILSKVIVAEIWQLLTTSPVNF